MDTFFYQVPNGGDDGRIRYSRLYSVPADITRRQNPVERYTALTDEDINKIVAAVCELDWCQWAINAMKANEAPPQPPAFANQVPTPATEPYARKPESILGAVAERERDSERHREQYSRKPDAGDKLAEQIARRHAKYLAAGTHRSYDQIASELS